MGLRTMLGLRRRGRGAVFKGTWPDRLVGLFDCGIDYAGRSVLDLGCNIGIVAYEVSKRGPRLIHGIDVDRESIVTAQRIFRAAPVHSRFEQIDAGDVHRLRSALEPSYDIVLFLSVYLHLPEYARKSVLETLAARCASTFVAGARPEHMSEIEPLLSSHGFLRRCRRASQNPDVGNITVVFERAGGDRSQVARDPLE
jgi:2-polyprenyl-3-methyl-5-hydroxy-6-metoxy-1,4-benzoquinol methylase